MATVTGLTRIDGDDLLAAAARMEPGIRARANEIERARRLPADLAAGLASAGFFRMGVPRSIGGLECDPLTLLAAIERIAMADASVGWCVMIGATSGLSAAYLPTAAAAEIFGAAETIAGGVFAPMGRASDEGDHYRLDGRWSWASGSANCHWLGGGAMLVAGGEPIPAADGRPEARMLFFPAGDAKLIDTWHVSGLCGTGSGDMEVRGLLVPKSRAVDLAGGRPVATGALYAFPVFGLLALGIAAVLIGNARAAMEELVALAGAKRPQGSRRTLAERGAAQATLADCEARLSAARAWLRETVEAAWGEAQAGGRIDLVTRTRLRLCASHAARVATDVVRAMFDLGGGSAVFEASPLQRRLRDGQVGATHMMVAPPTFELAGRVLMGLPTDGTQV